MRRRILAALLFLYPRADRERFGGEILDLMWDRLQRARRRGLLAEMRFWLSLLWDTSRSAVSFRLSDRVTPSALDGVLVDLRYAWRSLVRRRGFTATAILCMTLGLGATTAVFSAFYGVMVRPLPFSDPDRLAVLFETAPGFTRASPSFRDYAFWKGRAHTFSGMEGYAGVRGPLTHAGSADFVEGGAVTPGLFPLLGVEPVLGRGFTREDGRATSPATLILSGALWRRSFGSDPDVLGRTVSFKGEPRTIVGVMEGQFAFPQNAELWIPKSAERDSGLLSAAVARLAPGATWSDARTEMDGIARQLEALDPESQAERRVEVRPLEEDLLWGFRGPVAVFFLSVGLILVLATANVAQLMLAQGSARTREMILRGALGAGRARTARLLLLESLLVSITAGALGLALGVGARDLFLRWLPERLPYYLSFDLDARALLVLLGITVLVGLLFGLAPALAVARPDLFTGLRNAGDPVGGHRGAQRFRAVLVAAQVALALTVLNGAGAMFKSLLDLNEVDPGVSMDRVLSFQVSLPQDHDTGGADAVRFFDDLREEIQKLPAVESAASVSNLPIAGSAAGTFLSVEGVEPPARGHEPWVINKVVQPGFFHTMGIGILAGRAFSRADHAGTPHVVVVNEAFARHYWPDGNALGKRIKYGRPDSGWPWMEIVGVSGDVRQFGLDRPVEMGIYEVLAQQPMDRSWVVVHSRVEPTVLIRQVREIVTRLNPDAPMYDVKTMREWLYRTQWRPVVYARVFNVFSGIALLLGAVGIYGVVAFTAARRTREFAVRTAVGARRREVVGLAMRWVLRPVGLGLMGGVALSVLLTRLARTMTVGVGTVDLGVLSVTTVILVGVALVATYLPAYRATHVDPVTLLRSE